MFTITNKLRTIVALGAVGAALAGSGVASAAPLPQNVDSAGIPGYSRARCEALATLSDSLETASVAAVGGGDPNSAAALAQQQTNTENELENNCIVID
jgi:hypothetical protein